MAESIEPGVRHANPLSGRDTAKYAKIVPLSETHEVRVGRSYAGPKYGATVYMRSGPNAGMIAAMAPIGFGLTVDEAVADLINRLESTAATRAAWAAKLRGN